LLQTRDIPKLTVYTWTFIRLGKHRPRLATQHNAVKKSTVESQTDAYDIVY
jgi:hypothetical protein